MNSFLFFTLGYLFILLFILTAFALQFLASQSFLISKLKCEQYIPFFPKPMLLLKVHVWKILAPLFIRFLRSMNMEMNVCEYSILSLKPDVYWQYLYNCPVIMYVLEKYWQNILSVFPAPWNCPHEFTFTLVLQRKNSLIN